MIDSHLMSQLENLLKSLSVRIDVLDKDEASHDDSSLNDLIDGTSQQVGSRLCYPLNQPAVILACDASVPGASDILSVAALLVANVGNGHRAQESIYDIYRRILLGSITGSELDATVSEYDVPWDSARCVMLFNILQTFNETAYDFLREITPLQEKDVMVDIDRHTVALIKETSEVESEDELVQYAQALQETLMEETAHHMTVGIGSICHSADMLASSFSNAREAIDVGRIFEPEENIFCHDRLILERFLMEVPKDVRDKYCALLFNRRTARLFNDEMIYTIDMFFDKDLNLSDAARQLYIHRNTLVYRLDKIQRLTGLDLRNFDDAVTFKLLMEIKKISGQDKKIND